MATQASSSSSSSSEEIMAKDGGEAEKKKEAEEAEKENRGDPKTSLDLMDKTRELMSQQSRSQGMSQASQDAIGSSYPTLQSSESVEPNSSNSPAALNASKMSSQLSSGSSLDLHLEYTEDQQQSQQQQSSSSSLASRATPTGLFSSTFTGFSQENNETEFVESTSQESQALSHSLLPGLGSTPSAHFGETSKRTATSPPETAAEEGSTPQKRAKTEESVNDIFDISDGDEKEKDEEEEGDASANSIVIESPPSHCAADKRSSRAINDVDDKADDSVVFVGEITSQDKEEEAAAAAEIVDISSDSVKGKELPQLRMPQPRANFSPNNNGGSDNRSQELQDGSSHSESPFSRLIKRRNDEESTPSTPHGESTNNASAAGDNDQESSSLVVTRGSLNSSEPVGVGGPAELLMVSPDFAASPIEHAADMQNNRTAAGQKRSRISSTPGLKTTKKKSAVPEGRVISPSSEDEPQQGSSKRKKASPAKGGDEFKKPMAVETVAHFVIGGKDGLSHELVESARKLLLQDNRLIFEEFWVPREKSLAQFQAFQNFNHSFVIGSPENPSAAHPPPRPNRLSDASTTSSMSRSSSASGGGGYLADGSGVSSLSGGSKRDRLSMVPEASVDPHSVVSPLPGAASRKVLRKKRDWRARKSVGGDKSSTSDATTLGETAAAEVHSGAALSSKPNQVDGGSVAASQDIRPSSAADVREGCLVFAKYIERTQYRYWPAVVDTAEPDDKWKVRFDDGKERVLPNDELIPMSSLVPGNAVNVILRKEEAGVSQSGVLISPPDRTQPGKIGYLIKFDHIDGIPQTEVTLVPCEDVFLSPEQAKEIKKGLGGRWMTPTVSKADLDLSNIVCGTRIRQRPKSFVAASPMKTATPVKSATTPSSTPISSAKGKGRKKLQEWAETSAAEMSDAETSKTTRARRMLTSTEDEKESKPASTKTRRKGRRNAKESTDPLFKDMTFILTQGTRKTSNPAESDYAVETETEDDSERDQSLNDGPTFDRKELARQIEENGGRVLSTFPGVSQVIPEGLVVVSDRHCETRSFLLAILYGFHKVGFQWVLDSVRQRRKENLKNYYLPNGFSLTKQKLIEHHEIGELTTMLAGMNILVTSTNPHFVKDWNPLLARLGAAVSSRLTGRIDRNLKTIDVVLADHDCPGGVLDDARQRKIPVVSPSWIVQSLVNGSKLSTDNFLTHTNV